MDQNIKQQIIESINGTTNVLVTVSSDPTVDELAACIGLTLVLNKLGKHATAVFSGKVPSTLEFLKPDETLESNTDSLRDFIIALDKSKADKLRYKVEDSVVKIFITPYKTSIGQKDLEFSQGDFNIDVVMAIGVHKREELDNAITAHGRILHDATVVCINNKEVSNLGIYNWQDAQASSLCEMVVDLSETMHPDNFDAQIATALLTGIVAETGRFSNEKTTPRTMSLSAKLMAAGANQQLVASKLQTNLTKNDVGLSEEPLDDEEDDGEPDGGTLRISHRPSGNSDSDGGKNPPTNIGEAPDNEPMKEEPLSSEPNTPRQEKRIEPDVTTPPEEPAAVAPAAPVVPNPPAPASQISDVRTGPQSETKAAPEPPAVSSKPPTTKMAYDPPVMGGTLTANTKPESYEPPTDGISLPTPVNTPILKHDPTKGLQDDVNNKPIIDEETLSHIEKTTGSPHVAEVQDQAASAMPDVDALSQAAREAAEAPVNANQPPPLVASGASPLDMNVQGNEPPAPTPITMPDLPGPSTPAAAPIAPAPQTSDLPTPPITSPPPRPTSAPSASDVMSSVTQAPVAPAVPLEPLPTAPAASGGLPPQLVPTDTGLPPEQTASSTPQPLAPPPVPPPLLPGTPPMPSAGSQPPLPPIPPAPGV